MKTLILSVLSIGLATSVFAAGTPDPNDPFSPDSSSGNVAAYQCTSAQHAKAVFCGSQTAPTPDTSSCFKKETVNGCAYMKAHGAGIPIACTWSAEYSVGISHKTIPATTLCANQAQWCSKEGYKDCATVEQNCVADINQFRSQCMA